MFEYQITVVSCYQHSSETDFEPRVQDNKSHVLDMSTYLKLSGKMKSTWNKQLNIKLKVIWSIGNAGSSLHSKNKWKVFLKFNTNYEWNIDVW